MNSMNHPPRIGCLIMAAGNASRFGSNKLAAKVDGKMLIEHALETERRTGAPAGELVPSTQGGRQ